MNIHLRSIAAMQGGVFMRRQAIAAGFAADEIDYRVRRGEWVSLRRGAYVEREIHDAMTDEERHLALIHAVVRSLDKPAVVSHVSAALLRGYPTWGSDLSEVHVTRGDLHSPRREAGVYHHVGELLAGEVVVVDGVKVTSVERSVIDTARFTSFEAGVVTADAAFRADPAAHARALARLDTMRDWKGARHAGAVLAFADSRSESVGESRCRVLFHDVGLPPPDLQREFYGPDGRLIGRSDFYFEEERTIGEFDGKGKYLRSLGPDDDPGEIVWKEKKREDALRALGNEVGRVIWIDLDYPKAVAARFRRAFARARQRGGHAA